MSEDQGQPWASLVAQMVKNLPARKTWVQSLGQEDPLEKGMATDSSNLAWKIPWTEEPGGLHAVHEIAKNQTQLSTDRQMIIYILPLLSKEDVSDCS